MTIKHDRKTVKSVVDASQPRSYFAPRICISVAFSFFLVTGNPAFAGGNPALVIQNYKRSLCKFSPPAAPQSPPVELARPTAVQPPQITGTTGSAPAPTPGSS